MALLGYLKNLTNSPTDNYLLLPASFLIERGWEFGNGEWRYVDSLSESDRRIWAERQKPKLRHPIHVRVSRSGAMDFHDGHHRVYTAHVLGLPVKVVVEKNEMRPDIWKEYLDRIQQGFTTWEINPDGENLNITGVPSPAEIREDVEMRIARRNLLQAQLDKTRP